MSLEQTDNLLIEQVVDSSGPDEPAAIQTRTVWSRLWRNPTAMVALGFLGLITIGAVAAPLISPGNPLTINPAQRLRSPREGHIFGTDYLGRDVFALVLY